MCVQFGFILFCFQIVNQTKLHIHVTYGWLDHVTLFFLQGDYHFYSNLNGSVEDVSLLNRDMPFQSDRQKNNYALTHHTQHVTDNHD
jgi:hypothetical protein